MEQTIILDLQANIADNIDAKSQKIEGPFFHRWIPDSCDNAVVLPITEKGIIIKIWFEISKQTIVILDKKNINEDGKIEAGNLIAECSNIKISSELLEKLNNSVLNDPDLVKFSKDLYKYITHEINKFIKILSHLYGQYWLSEIPTFDSRLGSISYYWNASWKKNETDTFKQFLVDECSITIYSKTDENKNDNLEFKNYINISDWLEIPNHMQGGTYLDNIVFELIASANKHSKTNRLGFAFIDAYVALEIALNDLYKSKFNNSSAIDTKINDYLNNVDLPTKFVITASHYADLKKEQIENALESLKIRNKVAHEGYLPNSREKKYLYDLLDVINLLSGFPKIRRTKIIQGNLSASAEKWEELYKNEKCE
jgi:hypothetical protein